METSSWKIVGRENVFPECVGVVGGGWCRWVVVVRQVGGGARLQMAPVGLGPPVMAAGKKLFQLLWDNMTGEELRVPHRVARQL